jgi:molybdopterin synthase sulfur carrier subunit
MADTGDPDGVADRGVPLGMAVDQRAPLTVLWFAWLRERTGTAEELVTPPAEVATVGALIDWLSARSPGHASAFQNRRAVRCAVNQDFADPATPIRPGDEVAFFPPVTGG